MQNRDGPCEISSCFSSPLRQRKEETSVPEDLLGKKTWSYLWSGQNSKTDHPLLIPWPGLESISSLPDLHSQLSTGQCIKQKKQQYFLRKLWEWLFMKDLQLSSWVTNGLWVLLAKKDHRRRKSLALLVPSQLPEEKGKIIRMKTKYKYPRLVKCFGESLGMKPRK